MKFLSINILAGFIVMIKISQPINQITGMYLANSAGLMRDSGSMDFEQCYHE